MATPIADQIRITPKLPNGLTADHEPTKTAFNVGVCQQGLHPGFWCAVIQVTDSQGFLRGEIAWWNRADVLAFLHGCIKRIEDHWPVDAPSTTP